MAHTSGEKSRHHDRLLALDGLRGIAIALVVLSHGWALWPIDGLTNLGPFDGLFWSGNLAVTVFFVVGGFLVTRRLLSLAEVGRLNPIRFYLRRFVRIGAQLYPLLIAILATSMWHNGIDKYSTATTRDSVATAATYTWNWYLINHPFQARGDLGHLWYLSVEQQFYIVLAIALLLFSRYRRGFIAVTAGLVAATAIWRAHVLHTEGWWDASLRTTTRMDGLLLGVLVAFSVPYVVRYARHARFALGGSAIVMIALVFTASKKGELDYLRAPGLIFDIAAAVFLLGLAVVPASSAFVRSLSVPPLHILGTASLAIYIWHYPLFWAVARHTTTWNWVPRAVLAFALLAVVVVVAHLVIERPTKRWLASHLQPAEKRKQDRRDTPTMAPADQGGTLN